MNNKSIGIMDSGVGGLTVLKEMMNILPNENYVYFGDSKNNPYGEKSENEIINYCLKIGDFIQKQNVKIFLIACNTASKAALNSLKKELEIPTIGILKSGIDLAISKTKTKKIAVIATNYTAKTKAYSETLKKEYSTIYKDYKFQEIGSKNLANKIENGLKDMNEIEEIIKSLISEINEEFDTLILGCTHYPIVINIFKKYFYGEIVNPAEQMAIDVQNYLEEKDMLTNKKDKKLTIYTTGDSEIFYNTAKKLVNVSKTVIQEVRI